jgi:hypothetical protein
MTIAPDDRPVRRNAPHIVVIFAGASGSGKTTIQRRVEQLLNLDGHIYAVRESFAKPLKAQVLQHGHAPGTVDYRTALQVVGDNARAAYEDVYVDALVRRVRSHDPFPCAFLVDDGRRINEGQAGDLIFRLVTKRPNLLTEAQRAHVSENEWDKMYATETFVNDVPADIERISFVCKDKILAFASASEEGLEAA